MNMFMVTGAATALMMTAIGAAAMGASTPPPEPTKVERGAPARPGHERTAGAPSEAQRDHPATHLEFLLASDVAPEDLLMKRRAVVVFADSTADPAFRAQLANLEAQAGPLAERDVVVISDSDPSAQTSWRKMLKPNGFSLVLIDKDGQVKQRKPAPWDVREIVRSIDKFPLRRQEIGRMGVAL